MKSEAFIVEDSIDGRNCVLVCPGGNTSPCHAHAATKKGQRKCVGFLIGWEGPERIQRWLEKMNKHMQGMQAQNAIRLLEEVVDERKMQRMQEGSE
ncbi:MAG: hypothetical protein V3V85_01795 [Candidatus Thorarchaeota archaeon]